MLSASDRFREGPGEVPQAAERVRAAVLHAVANLRGGGEFGEEWHAAGRWSTR